MATQDDLLTVGDAAKALGVSAQTVRRWADSGHLTVVRTPTNQRRFLRSEVEGLLKPEPDLTP